MAACNPSTLLQNNPFTRLDGGLLDAIEAQLLYQWSGTTKTVSQLLNDACNNGFVCAVDQGLSDAIEAQLLCNILNA